MESASCFVQGHLAVSTGRPSLVSGSSALRLAEACAVPKSSSYRNFSKASELKNSFLSGADGQEFFSSPSFAVDTTRKFVSPSKETMFTVSLTASAMPVGQQPASGAVALKKVGVLLLNLGGPEKVEDVKPFLYNLFADPDILRTPLPFLQKPLAAFISQVRSKQSEENYKSIGGGSPIRRITEDQAEGVEKFLKAKGFENLKVYVGMRYWHPFTEEAIQQIKKDGIEKLVVLPLYPQFSVSTSGSSFRLLNQVIQEDPEFAKIDYTVIPSWYNRPGYIKCQADLIRTELEQFEDPSKAHIMFSAHGVPRSYVEQAGDPYQYEMERCVDAIMKTLNVSNEHTLCYQSRVGPVEWLRPYTEETIPELAQKGITDLLVVPISFVSEHIETLEEIDQEYRELAEESGIKRWRRVPALDTYQPFLQDLADMVEEALQSKKITVDDAFDAVSMRVVKKIPIGTRPMTAQEWGWGFTKIAEAWNGRLAMIASLLVIYELLTGHLAFK